MAVANLVISQAVLVQEIQHSSVQKEMMRSQVTAVTMFLTAEREMIYSTAEQIMIPTSSSVATEAM